MNIEVHEVPLDNVTLDVQRAMIANKIMAPSFPHPETANSHLYDNNDRMYAFFQQYSAAARSVLECIRYLPCGELLKLLKKKNLITQQPFKKNNILTRHIILSDRFICYDYYYTVRPVTSQQGPSVFLRPYIYTYILHTHCNAIHVNILGSIFSTLIRTISCQLHCCSATSPCNFRHN